MQALRNVLALAALFALAAGCPDSPQDSPRAAGKAQSPVGAEPLVQVKFEMARRALSDIRRAKSRGRSFYGDCRAVQLLAKAELRKQKDPAVQRLLDQIDKLCADVKAH